MSYNGLIRRAAVLPAANEINRTIKQLPEVPKTAVWGRLHFAWLGLTAIGGVATE